MRKQNRAKARFKMINRQGSQKQENKYKPKPICG